MSLEDTIRRIAGNPLPANEEAAKFKAIVPILRELGWDVDDSEGKGEVEYERPVGPGKGKGQTGRADIALIKSTRGKEQCVCLIEAKAPTKRLEDHVDQLVEYAYYEGVDLCVLTNSRKWWLYLPREQGKLEDCRFAEIDLDDALDRVPSELEQFLGKENVLSGDAEKGAKRWLKALQDQQSMNIELPKLWEDMTGTPDEELVDLVVRKASEKIGLRPSTEEVKAILLGNDIELSKPKPRPSRRTATTQSTVGEATTSTQNILLSNKPLSNKSPKLAYITLFGDKLEVESYRELYLMVCDKLRIKHGDSIFEVAIRNWPTAKAKVSNNRSDFRAPKKIENTSYWIETHARAGLLINWTRNLLIATGNLKLDLHVFDEDGNELIVKDQLVFVKDQLVLQGGDTSTKSEAPRAAPKPRVSQKPQTSSNKLSHISLLLSEQSVDSWAGVLRAVVDILFSKYGEQLPQLITDHWDGKKIPIASSPEDHKYSSYRVGNLQCWIDTHGSAPAMLKRSYELIETTGNSRNELRVYDNNGAWINKPS